MNSSLGFIGLIILFFVSMGEIDSIKEYLSNNSTKSFKVSLFHMIKLFVIFLSLIVFGYILGLSLNVLKFMFIIMVLTFILFTLILMNNKVNN